MTEENTDVRWLQRLTNFRKVLARLNDAVETAQARALRA